MSTTVRPVLPALVLVTVGTVVVGLVPTFYHRWWWWDVVVHAVAAGLLAVWGRTLSVPSGLAWPGLLAAMLGWEWLELSTSLLFSPTRFDLLVDLSVNAVAFGSVWLVLGQDGRADVWSGSRLSDDRS